jgi:hypothetical protein
VSTMKVTNLRNESSSVNNIVLNSDGSVGGELATALASKLDTSALPVLNVYYAELTAAQTASPASGVFFDITNLSITLTPESTASTFLLIANVYGSVDLAAGGWFPSLQLRSVRDATALSGAMFRTQSTDNAGIGNAVLTKKDSPNTTSSITYKIQATQTLTGGSVAIYINRAVGSAVVTAQSNLTILELAS